MVRNAVIVAEGNYKKTKIKSDRSKFFLVTFLYLLQGSVTGITAAIPIVLRSKNVTFKEQAEFNIVWYSYIFKIFWVPIINNKYIRRLGRRKSWLIISQYSIGTLLFLVSTHIDLFFGTKDNTQKPNVHFLTVTFFLCIFFNSIQDISVDGWALTMFQKKNVPYTASSQGIGFSFGFFLNFAGFILLDSKDFCNTFRTKPEDAGFVSHADFLYFWSMVLIFTTTLLARYMKENEVEAGRKKFRDKDDELGITETYVHLWKILKFRPIQTMSLFLLSWHIGFGPIRNVASLKLLEKGVPSDILALLTIPWLPFQLLLPMALNRYISRPLPMRVFLLFYVLRLVNGMIYASSIFLRENEIIPPWNYWFLVLIHNFDNLAVYFMMMTLLALFARISDPQFGGVNLFMTLLNSVNNLGSSLFSTICLLLVDFLAVKNCPSSIGIEEKVTCSTYIDGFYMEVIGCSLIGALWILWGRKRIHELEGFETGASIVSPIEHDVIEVL